MLDDILDPTVRKLAVGAVRLAAMAQLGPLAGGLFFAGGAVAAKVLAESEWAKTGAEMLMHLASDKASELFGSAAEGFRSGHNGDVEKSMHQAALEAIAHLRAKAPAGFDDWFVQWESYLRMKPDSEVFASACGLNPVMLEYDDERFRDLWWGLMEPVLVGWRNVEGSSLTQLHLTSANTLPKSLAAFLRERLPQAMQEAHETVLRDEDMKRSWIGFQQRVYRETLNDLRAIRQGLAVLIAGQSEIKNLLEGRIRGGTVWNIPLSVHHSQDRPDLIAAIDHSLAKGVTALTALHGLGGIGKTQLARAYAHQRHELYKLGLWIEAETEVSVLSSFSALAPLLGGSVEKDQHAMAAWVLNALSAHAPWLVIFDNAESADALRPYVEKLSGKGHVLITSRNEQWDGLASTVSVTQWSVEESARFLLERTGQSDRAAAEGLAWDLDGLVLALEHAAAYMLAGDGMALSDYRTVWRDKLKWVAKGQAYPDSVAGALGLSIEAVAKKSVAAYELLCLFSWLASDRIPRKELLAAGAAALPDVLAASFADRDEWAEVIGTLGRYSFLKREKVEGMVTGYSVHQVVQQVVRDRLYANDTQAQWLGAACNLVAEAFLFDPREPAFWPASEALLPHARVIREHARNGKSPHLLGLLVGQASIYLMARGQYREGRAFQELAVESALAEFGQDHATVALYRSNLASFLIDAGDYAAARQQIDMALESQLRQFGPDHPSVAVARSNLASILSHIGDHKEARNQVELALESQLQQFGPDHPSVAISRVNLGHILNDLREYASARQQIGMALESQLRQLGPDHPEVAACRLNLGGVLRNLGQHDEAQKQFEMALDSNLRRLGPDHPNVDACRSSLSDVLFYLGHFVEARKQIELALGSASRHLEPDHPNVASIRYGLSKILFRSYEPEAALKGVDQALEILRTKLPPGHAYTREIEGWREYILSCRE